MNKLRPPVKGVAVKIRKLFREIETSNEPLRSPNYVMCLSQQGYEPGMLNDAHECLLQLLGNIYLSFNDDYMFKATDALRGFNNVYTISGMLNQLIDPKGEYLENYR